MHIIDERIHTTIFQSVRDVVMAYNNVGDRDDFIYHSTMLKHCGQHIRALGDLFSTRELNPDE